MLAAALLVLSLSNGSPVQSSRLEQLAQPAVAATPASVSKGVPVILDCQIAAKTLTDCRAVGAAAEASVVAEAIRMAGVVPVPEALAESGVRIRIRMNVAP